MHSPGSIAATDEEAREAFFPTLKVHRDRVGRTRGWAPMTREQFDHEVEHGSLYVGSPETVAQKIATSMRTLDADRFDLVYGFGPQTPDMRMQTVRLFGEQVAPRVRELLDRPRS